MTKSTSLPLDNETEFVLKHRIVGAALLLFFGALFLPWLLGAPSEAKKSEAKKILFLNGVEPSAAVRDIAPESLESELLKAIASEQFDGAEDQVYISKITPLDTHKGLKEGTRNTVNKSSEPIVKKQANEKESQQEMEPKKTDIVEPTTAVKTPKMVNSKLKPESKSIKTSKIKVGWIVQVGVFTDKKGATQVVEDLQRKGFSPSTTTVDTNVGKATGTRIWLGPFAQRVDAGKAKSRLSEKTGEAGFIRAYP